MATLKIPQLTASDVKRFWEKVQILPSGCWEWTASRNRYGTFRIADRTYKSHRVAYAIYYGTGLGDLGVLHRCDFTFCVNPLHLFLGTQRDNVMDMIAKGRARFDARNQRGELNALSKLTAEDVRDIRLRCLSGETHRSLAKEYAVCFQTISDIMRRKNWAHID